MKRQYAPIAYANMMALARNPLSLRRPLAFFFTDTAVAPPVESEPSKALVMLNHMYPILQVVGGGLAALVLGTALIAAVVVIGGF